jgi:hypothetical protein
LLAFHEEQHNFNNGRNSDNDIRIYGDSSFMASATNASHDGVYESLHIMYRQSAMSYFSDEFKYTFSNTSTFSSINTNAPFINIDTFSSIIKITSP